MPSDRKCFRMIGGTLVEGTVGEVLPALEQTQNGVWPPLKALLIILVKTGCGATDGTVQEERGGVQEMAKR